MEALATPLGRHVRHYLTDPATRAEMAAAAHSRAVPDYAIDKRAAEVIAALRASA